MKIGTEYARRTRAKEEDDKISYRKFLLSEKSGPKFEFNRSTKQSLIYYLKKYRNGTLKATNVKRARVRKFATLEDKLVRYLEARADPDKCGVSWLGLKRKCLHWQSLDPLLRDEKFECSPGWISAVLQRNDMSKVKLHGEGDSMTKEEEMEKEAEEPDKEKPVATISDAHAVECIGALREYCAQQGFDKGTKNMVDALDRQLRTIRLTRPKTSPSLPD
mmetsp:Transcript_19299/g.25672  ORF Transcript_19299/g.25672 Transcript_19299/m.25672 type:complete len:219 (+) Transcript_19299:50-706(+)